MSIETLSERADELRGKGLSTREICQELHLSRATIEWLLAKQASKPGERPPADVKAGWRTIGVSGFRMRAVAEIMADIILEEQEKHDFDVEVIAGEGADDAALVHDENDVGEADDLLEILREQQNSPVSVAFVQDVISDRIGCSNIEATCRRSRQKHLVVLCEFAGQYRLL